MSTDKAAAQGALSHIKVLDLSRVLAGPWCTQMLADLGADVIKVERPGLGDDTRTWGPPFAKDAQGQDTTESTYFLACNRNKRAIALDMAKPEGQAIIRELAKRSDVLVENFKVGGLKQYGLDYDSLKAVNPRLIYCSVTGFGQTGPHAERAGYDLMIQATSGLMSVTGQPDGSAGGGPLRVGVAVIDVFTGIYACSAILAAIEARHHSGQGQHIDMALLDVGMAVLANQATGFLNSGKVPQRQGNSHPSLVPYQDFETADGAMLLAIGNDGQFARFCEAAGQSQWSRDERFSSNTLRVQHRDVLIPMMQAVTRTRTTAAWIELLEKRAVPVGPINDIGQAFADAQVQARGLALAQAHTADPKRQVRTVASPMRLSANPPVVRRPPPRLGEHTQEVLTGLGMSASAIEALKADGVIGAGS